MLSRRAVGTGVAGGMLAASLVGIFLIPSLYVVFQWLRERAHGLAGIGRTPPVDAGHPEATAAVSRDEAAQ